MKFSKSIHGLAMTLFCAGFAALNASQPAVAAVEPDWLTVVGLYPQPSTGTAQTELAILLWLQNARTPQDVARAESEGRVSLGCFASDIHLRSTADAMPKGIEIADFPKTAAVLEQAREDMEPVLAALQNTYLRPQPFVSHPAVQPVLPKPAGFSYPSSHAALGVVYSKILAQLDPGDAMGFTATAKLLGTDRVLGGVHYPSDVEAGRRFGQAFATFWLDQPEHLKLLQTACSEWHPK